MQEYSGTINGKELEVSVSDVKEAFEETEAGYNEFLYSPWHFVELEGRKKPVKDVFENLEQVRDTGINKSNFGTPNAERFFEKLDISLFNRREKSPELLIDTIREVVERYGSEMVGEPVDSERRVRGLVAEKAPNLVKHVLVKETEFTEADLEIEGSTGDGRWSSVPWVAINSDEKEKLEHGSNPVFFIDFEENELILTLSQRVKKDEDNNNRTDKDLKKGTDDIQSTYTIEGFSKGPVELDKSGIGRKYGPATAFYKKYDLDDLNSDELVNDTAQITTFFLNQINSSNNSDDQELTENKLENLINVSDIEIEIPDELYFENAVKLRNEIGASLNSGKNIIFTGPPGTGKTKLAKSISSQVSRDEEKVEGSVFTTATADWTAFDTIGGYMPSQDGGDELEFNSGQFLKCFRKESGEVTNKWLVIDEINRSDIDKAFGQLFSVLSGDSVELPYKKDGHVKLEKVESEQDLQQVESDEDIYPVTDSWRLIATMNTYDKTSLYDMSYAFMRRFSFVHVGVPDLENDEGYRTELLNPDEENYSSVWELEDVLSEDALYEDLTVLWAEVNRQRDIGPSIIKDIIEFVDAHSGENSLALAQAVNSLILPQFEGLRREKQKEFINKLREKQEDGELSLNVSLVEEKASNMFNIDFEDD